MRWILLLGLLAIPAAADTTVRFSEAREVRRLPGEFVATLRAETRAPTAAAAQDGVNRAVAAALARAGAVAGIELTTGRYGTWRTSEGNAPAVWQAGQDIVLRTSDHAAGMAMVGVWQEQGLSVAQLGWRLTPQQQVDMREEATRSVLAALEARLALVAAALRLTADGLARVELDDAGEAGLPRPMTASLRQAAAAVAVPEELGVTVRATAEAVLQQR